MTRLPSSPDGLSCLSWLVYATRATNESARRVKTLVIQIKQDRLDVSGMPVVRQIVERIMERLGDRATEGFENHPVLVPIPRAGLMKPRTVWPALRVCEELVRVGLADDVLPILRRAVAVEKSAGASSRPSLQAHVDSLAIQANLRPPSRIVIVDDVVTSGTTMMACATKVALAYPDIPVSGFALARVQSAGDARDVLAPAFDRISIDGERCRRR